MNTDCPREEQLALFFEEALDETAQLALEGHTHGCAPCQGVLARLQALDTAMSEPDALPPGFLNDLLALPDSAAARPRVTGLLVVAAAAAAVLLVALVLRSRIDTMSQQPALSPERAMSADQASSPARSGASTAGSVAIASVLPALSMPALHRLARGADLGHARLALARLGQLARRESLPVLIDVVRRADRRAEAVQALGALGDARAVRTLEPLLGDPLVATQVREALVRVGGGEAAAALGRAIDVAEDAHQAALLIDALAQADGVVGIRQLGRLLVAEEVGRAEAARRVIRRYEDRLLPHALAVSAGALGSDVDAALLILDVLAPTAAVPALKRLLRQRVPRERAARLLMRIDTAEAAAALWEARHLAEARRSFRHGGPATERYLLDRLSEGSRPVRRSAIDLLGLCGGPRAVSPLAARVVDPALASGVLLSLGRIGGEAAVAVLAALSERPALQRRAIAALGMTGCSAAVPELERLGATTRSLCGDAQRALASLPYADAVEAIVRLDGSRRSHRSAERALRGMDRELVLTTLDTLLERDPPVGQHLAATARRVRRAVGGRERTEAPRIALN